MRGRRFGRVRRTHCRTVELSGGQRAWGYRISAYGLSRMRDPVNTDVFRRTVDPRPSTGPNDPGLWLREPRRRGCPLLADIQDNGEEKDKGQTKRFQASTPPEAGSRVGGAAIVVAAVVGWFAYQPGG